MKHTKKISQKYIEGFYLLMIAYLLIYPLFVGVFKLMNYSTPENSLLASSFSLALIVYLFKPIRKYVFSIIIFAEITFIGLVVFNWIDWIRFINRNLFKVTQYLFQILNVELIVDSIHSYKDFFLGNTAIVLFPTYFEILIQLFIIFTVFYFVFEYKSPMFLLGLSLVFIYGWFQYREIEMTTILLYLMGMLLYTYEYYHYKSFRKGEKNAIETSYYRFKALRLSYLLIGVIIFLSTQLIFAFFPLNEVNQKVSKYVPTVEGLRTAYYKQKTFGYYTLENSIYHPRENELGGSIEQRGDQVLFLVKTGAENKYFRGRTKNKYTGKQWINENINYKNGLTVSATKDIYQAEIQPVNLKTITIFSPYRFIKSSFQSDYVFSNDDAIQFYRGPKTPMLEKNYTVYWTENHLEKLSVPEQRKYSLYPRDNLKETIKITNSIINKYMTDFEKINAIQSYLTQSSVFEYSLTVSDRNQSKDFVENFLVNEREGYCTYFASAMAVMGRIAKVPTRYVEGFILPNERNEDGLYEVTELRAHAWVEAYIDGEGWITVEATPAYQVENEASSSDAFNDALSPNSGLDNNGEYSSEKDLDIEENFLVEEEQTRGNYSGLIGFLVLVLSLSVFLIRKKIKDKEKAFQQLTTHEQSKKYIGRIIQLLVIKGYNKKSHEFSLEFIDRKLRNELMIILDAHEYKLLEKVFYTNRSIITQEFLILESLYERVFDEVLGEKSSLVQFYYRLRIR